MKKTIVAALAAALMSSGAYAADAFDKGSTKDAGIFSAPAAVNWTGFYVGGRIGYGHANHDLTVEAYQNSAEEVPASCSGGTLNQAGTACATVGVYSGPPEEGTANATCAGGTLNADKTACTAPGTYSSALSAIDGFTKELFGLNGLDSSGVTGGGQLGFDLQRGRFVFGVFGSYDASAMEATASLGGTELKLIEKGDEWSVGARAGLLVNPRTLAYILAAYTESDFDFAGLADDGGSKEITFSGITVGGGVEFALTQNVFLGVEGTHTFYSEETLFDFNNSDTVERGASGIRGKDEIGETKVMGTLKIKLNTGLGGVID